jgi:Do/DeqQ family serine protease
MQREIRIQAAPPRPRRRLVESVTVAVLMAGSAVAGSFAVPSATAPVVLAAPAVAAAPLAGSYADVVAQVAPAVVTVRAQKLTLVADRTPGQNPFEEFFGRRMPQAPQAPRREGAMGSGVVVSGEGYILTNHHVVEGAKQVSVEMSDGRTLKAAVIGTDAPSDLAVLKVDVKGLKAVPMGDSDQVRVGDVALAFGNPLGVGQTVTMGIVSAKGRATGLADGSFEDFIQTDAPINRGNSGGALINARGELIGINSQILSPSGGNIGIGFAIPANMARNVMDQLVAGGTVRRGMLGVTAQTLTSDLAAGMGLQQVKGALVSAVSEGSPAAKAGVKRGDVILRINGESVDDSNALRNKVSRLQPGSTATLGLVRGGRQQELRVQLAELPRTARDDGSAPPQAGPAGALGLAVAPGDSGVEVTRVDPSGPAAGAGIRAGDVLEEVNGKSVRSASDLRSALARSDDKPALMLVRRGDQTLYVAVPPAA